MADSQKVLFVYFIVDFFISYRKVLVDPLPVLIENLQYFDEYDHQTVLLGV